MGDEFCFPADDIIKTLEKFDSLNLEKRDTVGADLRVSIELEDGEVMPEQVELRDGDKTAPVVFDEENRSIGLASQARIASRDSKLCFVDPPRAARTHADRGYAIDFGMGVRFLSAPGQHTLDEIKDGLKDGRSHYKKMVGAMGFMVPKFDHIAIANDEETPPTVWATADGIDIGEPAFELYDGARMISLDTLEEMGAHGIRVDGVYRMTPSPDAKTVAKFAGGD